MTALEHGIAFLYQTKLEQMGIQADVTCQITLNEPEDVKEPGEDCPAS